MRYKVKIDVEVETYDSFEVEIEADSEEEAMDKAENYDLNKKIDEIELEWTIEPRYAEEIEEPEFEDEGQLYLFEE